MENFSRRELDSGIFLNSVKDERFKTGRISANISTPLRENTAAENALLIQLLGRSCKAYPDYISLNREMNRLYGASLSTQCAKLGDLQQLSLSMTGLDDRYTLNGEKLSKELAGLLCKMLFEPKREGEAFSSYDTEQERRKLLETMQAEINEKRSYAITRCVGIMCENDSFGIRKYGSPEQLKSVTPKQLYSAWQRLLSTSVVNIMVAGELDADAVGELFKSEFNKIERAPENIETKMFKRDDKVKEETERQNVAQSKLVMGFSCGINVNDDRVDAAKLMAIILGGTPSSKLFVNVREKQSLCYYCASSYNRQKGIILVDSGVENQNIEKAKNEILNQIEQMKLGNITDFEISAAKLAVEDSSGMVTDSISAIESFYISQIFENEILSPQEAAKRISAVTKEQIIEAASCVELAAVYVLTNGEAEK